VAPTTSGNLGDRFLDVAATSARRPAIVVDGDEPIELSYAQLRARAGRLAGALRARGVRPGDRVGVLLANGNEHLEVLLASFLLRAVPVNLSHRDSREGLDAIVEASGASFVVHEPDLDRLLPDSSSLARGSAYESALREARGLPDVDGRSGDDEYVLYTGGTTGRPKGVRWRHGDLYAGALEAAGGDLGLGRAVRCLVASPFAHGTGQWMALTTLLHGGTVVCRRDRSLDPEALLDTVDARRPSFLVVVGDAFAWPIVELLDACPGRWSLASLTTVLSGGAALTPAVKGQLLRLVPTVLVVDGFGASESGGHGRMVSVAGSVADGPPRFVVDDDTTVLDADDDGIGWLARRGPIPLGYDGDDDATARTFPTIDGVRWALTGDRARREDDGTITVLGRGATTINTGGHKVQAEEVERCVRTHPAVRDAIVVGVPDERFGERITAVVSARHDARPTLESVRRHCTPRLASFKVPRRLVVVDEVQRSAAGKPDYAWARSVATA
jgi:fatty-acyl-CoA synthase